MAGNKFMYIDGNSIGYASQHTNKLTVGGREVQAIFQFIKTIRNLVSAHRGYTPLVLWDGRAQWRFDLYPDYKGNRNKDSKSAEEKAKYEEQKPTIIKALYHLGVRQLRVKSAEADDMAGIMTKKAVRAGNKVLLISCDQDWIQLVSENCTWHDPIRDNTVTLGSLPEFTGYADPKQFLQGKALVGDTSDNIKGVGGIGEKGAPEFLMQYGSVEEFFKLADEGKLPKKLPKAHERFAKNEEAPRYGVPMRDAYYRNMKLMDLANSPVPDSSEVNIIRGSFNPNKFQELCEELAFASILRDFDNWIRPFQPTVEAKAT